MVGVARQRLFIELLSVCWLNAKAIEVVAVTVADEENPDDAATVDDISETLATLLMLLLLFPFIFHPQLELFVVESGSILFSSALSYIRMYNIRL